MAEINLGAVPRIGASDIRIAATGGGNANAPADETSVAAAGAKAGVSALDAGHAPVDSGRVSQIRHAIAQGKYPIIPTRIGDAMIAAGILLRSPNP